MFNQDFHFAFQASSQYTPRRLRSGRFFILSIPSDSGRTGRCQLIDDDIENVFLREEATYFDRKEKRKKKTSSIWALSLEVEGDDMRKLIANLTENARLFAETRKLLGSSGKVLEVVEDEREQAPEVTAEFYPASVNGSSATEPTEAASTETAPGRAPSNPPIETPPPGNGTRVSGGNGIAKPRASETPSSPAPNNGNGSAANSGFNQLRNEFLTAARRVATTKKRAIGEVVEWASGGAFKYGDVGRMTEAHAPKLRAATELMASTLAGAPRSAVPPGSCTRRQGAPHTMSPF